MGAKIDTATAREINELFHALILSVGRASGIGMIQAVNDSGLSFSQMIILSLFDREIWTVSGLAEALGVTPGAASRLVDRLVRKGLVRRREGEGDRRQKALSLTPAGRRLRDRLERARTGSFVAALSELDRGLAADLKNVLGRVTSFLESRAATTESRTP